MEILENRDRNRNEIFESIMIKNFPELMPNYKPQIHEAWRTTSRINANTNVGILFSSYRNQKIKKNSGKKKSERNEVRVGTPYLCLNKELLPTSAQKSCKKEKSEVQYVFRENATNLGFCRLKNYALKVEDK